MRIYMCMHIYIRIPAEMCNDHEFEEVLNNIYTFGPQNSRKWFEKMRKMMKK
jgi:hypothetical protein